MRLLLALLLLPLFSVAQQLTGEQLLERAIAYHDPQGNWDTFNGTLYVTMETPNSDARNSKIQINLPQEYFQVEATQGDKTTRYQIDSGECTIALNGKTDLSPSDLEENKLSCERATLYKNYYTYLYGLPMKLKDPGTYIDPVVEQVNFKDKDYLRLKVTYDEAVGTDIWFFYFDPKTYAMEVYQFYKGDPEDKGKDTGEYILLSDEVEISGIKMPKDRAWYYNKGDKYLGTDFLFIAGFKTN